ncbi:MAG TPA: nuclear transport factor 2 family protein [Chitinophagaceae bacterium]|nr:nuclear transport factor 2 family protein [Chitinophagaceae bacterium]
MTIKNLIFKAATPTLIFTMLLSCNSTTQGSSTGSIDKEQIKKEIQAREDEFAEVYNSGKIKEIGYYADDAVTYFQNRPPLVGKEAIIEFLKSDIDSNFNTISFKTKEVFPSNDGNQVVEIGYFELLDSANIVINTGNYMALFEKRNGKYVSVRDMSVSTVPVR